MCAVDKKCPICGTLNKGLYLDETDGWFVCEKCGAETKDLSDEKNLVPVYKFVDILKPIKMAK